MQLTVNVDSRRLLFMLQDKCAQQVPYAVSLALNRVANKAQQAERDHTKQAFKLRMEDFVLKGIKIAKEDRANKTTWRVLIQLSYPNNRVFMDDHEEGRTRIRHGGKRLWQPNKDVFKSKIIGRANPLHPKSLKLHKDKTGRIVGEQRTYLVRKGKQVLIFQREDRVLSKRGTKLSNLTLDNVAVGMGPHGRKQKAIHRNNGTRLLYRLVDRVKIPARLAFERTIKSTAEQAWQGEFNRALEIALKSAK